MTMPFNLSLSRILTTTLSVAVVGLVFVLVPVFASADILGQYYGNNNCGTSSYTTAYTSYYGSTPTQNCGPGSLLVYVQVPANAQTGFMRYPGDFTVTVSGINPSPASFPGSLNGTPVLVSGNYSVTALPVSGFNATYSAGCSGNFFYGDHGLCIVTEYPTGGDYGTVTPYPYPYNANVPLACAPSYQTVTLGQAVTLSAIGGSGGVYNWATPNQTYLAAKSSITTTLQSTGTQVVTVSNGTQTASCTVNVVGGAGPVVYSNSSNITYIPPTTSSVTTSYITPSQPRVTSAYVPALPNTGFEPLSVMLGKNGGAPLAFALVLLAALGIFLAPYARKIIIAPTR